VVERRTSAGVERDRNVRRDPDDPRRWTTSSPCVSAGELPDDERKVVAMRRVAGVRPAERAGASP